MTGGPWLTVRAAWERALYEPDGFYRAERPADHFRTSTHASSGFAEAIIGLVRAWGLGRVTDLGSGEGELLTHLHRLAPDIGLAGVEVRPRPAALPDGIAWHHVDTITARESPQEWVPESGLVIANELLDNIPCDVVEVDEHGERRLVEVDVSTSQERLGEPAGDRVNEWLDAWWPLTGTGARAEVGLTREAFWTLVCDQVTDGVVVAIDYGHLRATRPEHGTLMSYRHGRATPPVYDGLHDVTAHIAADALTAAVRGELTTQREVLRGLGLVGGRPDHALAGRDPAAYVHALSRASREAELIASPGLGDFAWIITARGHRFEPAGTAPADGDLPRRP